MKKSELQKRFNESKILLAGYRDELRELKSDLNELKLVKAVLESQVDVELLVRFNRLQEDYQNLLEAKTGADYVLEQIERIARTYVSGAEN